MKAEPWIYSLARKMLGKEKLDTQLTDYLEEIETFADLAHGSIQSRQVVALAIVNYLDRREMQKKISKLEKDIDRLKGLDTREDNRDWRTK
tara:strand:- start:1454 stop:1726 length:273 start_codon:yes stop_codon:yes gene_type:complete